MQILIQKHLIQELDCILIKSFWEYVPDLARLSSVSGLIRSSDTGKAPLRAGGDTEAPSEEGDEAVTSVCLWHGTLLYNCEINNERNADMTQSYNQSNTMLIVTDVVVISSPGLNLKTHKNTEQGQSSLIPAQRAIISVKFLLVTLLWC